MTAVQDSNTYPEHYVSVQLSSPAPPELSGLPPWTPPHCGMVGCWQINYIFANIGSNFKLVPLLIKYVNVSIVIGLITFFNILEIKVALISDSLSKEISKVAENNGVASLLFAVPDPEIGHGQTRWWLSLQTAVARGSWAGGVFPLWRPL